MEVDYLWHPVSRLQIMGLVMGIEYIWWWSRKIMRSIRVARIQGEVIIIPWVDRKWLLLRSKCWTHKKCSKQPNVYNDLLRKFTREERCWGSLGRSRSNTTCDAIFNHRFSDPGNRCTVYSWVFEVSRTLKTEKTKQVKDANY
jgi:hypothetical protein